MARLRRAIPKQGKRRRARPATGNGENPLALRIFHAYEAIPMKRPIAARRPTISEHRILFVPAPSQMTAGAVAVPSPLPRKDRFAISQW